MWKPSVFEFDFEFEFNLGYLDICRSHAFITGLLLGTFITGGLSLFDINKKKKTILNYEKLYNDIRLENKEITSLYRTLFVESTEKNERNMLLKDVLKYKNTNLENENKILNKMVNRARNCGLFGVNIVNNEMSAEHDFERYYHRHNYKTNNGVIMIGNFAVVKQAYFEV